MEVFSCLMRKAQDIDICKGMSIGNKGFHLTHLQFAHDALLFCKPNLQELLNMRRVIKSFQLMFGLKINFMKSCLFGVAVQKEIMESWGSRIHYKVGHLLTSYLGLPLGLNVATLKIWNLFVDRVEDKLEW